MNFASNESNYSTDEMTISVEEVADFESEEGIQCFVIKINGELNIFSSGKLKMLIQEIAEKGNLRICMDLSDLVYLDSSGIAVFIGAYALLRRKNSDMILFDMPGPIDRILDMIRVKRLFKTAATKEEAIGMAVRP